MAAKPTELVKQYAYLLFTRERLTQKEVSEKTGVSANTINRWVEDGNWKQARNSYSVTREAQLQSCYNQMTELNQTISEREEGKRYATSSEADTLLKLAHTIKTLETEVSLDEVINVFISFLEWLRDVDPVKAKEMVELQDAYIKQKLL